MATSSLGQDIKEFLENEKDIEFEEEISRNPYRLKSWWRYLLAKEGAKPKTRNIIHERALKFLPNRSVWIWFGVGVSPCFVGGGGCWCAMQQRIPRDSSCSCCCSSSTAAAAWAARLRRRCCCCCRGALETSMDRVLVSSPPSFPRRCFAQPCTRAPYQYGQEKKSNKQLPAYIVFRGGIQNA